MTAAGGVHAQRTVDRSQVIQQTRREDLQEEKFPGCAVHHLTELELEEYTEKHKRRPAPKAAPAPGGLIEPVTAGRLGEMSPGRAPSYAPTGPSYAPTQPRGPGPSDAGDTSDLDLQLALEIVMKTEDA